MCLLPLPFILKIIDIFHIYFPNKLCFFLQDLFFLHDVKVLGPEVQEANKEITLSDMRENTDHSGEKADLRSVQEFLYFYLLLLFPYWKYPFCRKGRRIESVCFKYKWYKPSALMSLSLLV